MDFNCSVLAGVWSYLDAWGSVWKDLAASTGIWRCLEYLDLHVPFGQHVNSSWEIKQNNESDEN